MQNFFLCNIPKICLNMSHQQFASKWPPKQIIFNKAKSNFVQLCAVKASSNPVSKILSIYVCSMLQGWYQLVLSRIFSKFESLIQVRILHHLCNLAACNFWTEDKGINLDCIIFENDSSVRLLPSLIELKCANWQKLRQSTLFNFLQAKIMLLISICISIA